MTRLPAPVIPALAAVSSMLLTAAVARAQGLEPPPPLVPETPGVAPPRPMPSMPVMPPSRASYEEEQDSGLGLEWVWLNADVGGSYVNMQSLNASNFALQKTESGGPAFGVGAGVRLLFLTVGVRVRDLVLTNIGNLWELNAEAKLHTRVWHIDPYFGVRGGYNFVGSLSSDSAQVAMGSSPSDVTVHGFNVGPVIGIDGYFSKLVSIGFDVDAQFLFLQRPPVPLPANVQRSSLTASQQQLYDNSGSSVGFSVTPTVHLGIHF